MRPDRGELRFGDCAHVPAPVGRASARSTKMPGDSSTGPRGPGPAAGRRKAKLEPTETELEDVEIVRRVLAGEEDLFEVLVRRYQARVVSHVTRMVGNRDDALDLSQEIFLKVFQALDRFNPAYKFSTWLFRIAGNAAIDHLRKRRPRTVPLETPDPDGHRAVLAGAALDGARPLRGAAQRRAGQGHQPGHPGAAGRFSGADRPAALRRAVLRGDRRGQEHAPRDRQEQTLSRQSRIEGKVVGRSDVTPCPRPLDPIDAEARCLPARIPFSPPTPPSTPGLRGLRGASRGGQGPL